MVNLDLKHLDIFSLPALPLADRAFFPDIPALYFVICADEIVYIGQTKSLLKRWLGHDRLRVYKQFPSVRIAWIEVDDIWLLPQLEHACIRYFTPRDNGKSADNCYRLQVFLPRELQKSLKLLAIRHNVSLQRFVVSALAEKAKEYPEGRALELETDK